MLLGEPGNFRYFLELNGGDRQEKFELANWKTRLMLPVSPGTYYQVIVEAVTPDKFVVASGKASFKAGNLSFPMGFREFAND